MVIAVNALGITQITAWGTSYYCLGVLAKPIVAETGWAMSTVFLGFSVALLVMGFISTWVGYLIDRMGARAVMTIGTIIVSGGLLALSQVRDPASYWAVWAVLGLGMRCCLYDAAFAALVQVTPTRGRTAISYLTLYGAYASTVFWVIGHYLNEVYGWRGTLMIFAAIHLTVCLPLNWVGLSRREAAGDPATARPGPASLDGPVLQGRMRTVGMILFALIMSINGFVFGVVSLQLVPLLEAAGLASATAVWVASLKGHGQCTGRLLEIFLGRNLKAMTIARIAIGGVPVAWLLFLLAGGEFWRLVVFTLLLGASQGVITIVRGAVPLALFGAQGYGAVLGLIATPILLVNAFSPALFALAIDRLGQPLSLYMLLGCSIVTWVAIELMSRWYENAQQQGENDSITAR
ncbi:MAG: MFS transporter [Candidatus Tectomicrobia bacterium]|uniref:MFS transporter n=1 Tax=Tectimicrobiota bacterium TaxID=2528274 RepID=A0A937W440_UNCTE|nr:MFS transporter [Candidatus Tectomicrobia bacterium]